MKSDLQRSLVPLLAIGFLVILLHTRLTGSGIEESYSPNRASTNAEVAARTIPDSFSSNNYLLLDVAIKKRLFMTRLLPHIEVENQSVARQRERLASLLGQTSLSNEDEQWLHGLASRYRLDTSMPDADQVNRLLGMVDKLPPSLVLAQAAIESGWGTSRFARDGNSVFGQWCMVEGCGIVPGARDGDAAHEVKKYASLGDSMHAYFMNINSHVAYIPLRQLRSCQREQGQALSGPILAAGLLDYAAIGERYVDTVRSVIQANRWEKLDNTDQQPAAANDAELDCSADLDLAPQATATAPGE